MEKTSGVLLPSLESDGPEKVVRGTDTSIFWKVFLKMFY